MSWDADLAAAWGAHLQSARWFSGKGRSFAVVDLRPLHWYTPPGTWPAVRSELVQVRYGDGGTECYQLVSSYLPAGTAAEQLVVATTQLPELGEVDVLDATAHPESMAAMVRGLVDDPPEQMEWHDVGRVNADAPMRRFTGEQSNTTVVLSPDVLLKLFRRLEPGRNLDAEVLAALPGTITPPLYGVLAAGGYDLAIFYQRVTGVVDGWVFATTACADGIDISPQCRQLGATLRLLHGELVEAFGASCTDGRVLAEDMRTRYRVAASEVPALGRDGEALESVFAAVAGRQLATQRIHGDFHLGQALLRDQAEPGRSWVIIDFEGEPLKTLAERRELDSVWRDVAGALRSIDYVRSAHADPSCAAARAWCDRAQRAFLDGYAGQDAVPSALLAAYELDKAVYEVVYETRNRPDWAHIPLSAVQDEAKRVLRESSAAKE